MRGSRGRCELIDACFINQEHAVKYAVFTHQVFRWRDLGLFVEFLLAVMFGGKSCRHNQAAGDDSPSHRRDQVPLGKLNVVGHRGLPPAKILGEVIGSRYR